MSQHVEHSSRALEWLMGLLTGATALGIFHWILGVPAAVYYVVKVYRMLKHPKHAKHHK